MLERKPILLIDNAEQRPLNFEFIKEHGWDFKVQSLDVSDYSVFGLQNSCGMERKSIQDVVMCCCSKEHERFRREIITLRGFKCKAVVIEADYSSIEKGLDDNGKKWRSQATPEQVLKTIHSLQNKYEVPFIFTGSREASARYIFRSLSRYYETCRDWVKLFDI
jgi:ERCC4-type nuclease